MDFDLKKRIEDLINSNSIMVFMKGSKMMPQCGFSNNVVQILNSLGINFETFDVLEDFEIREAIKEYSKVLAINPYVAYSISSISKIFGQKVVLIGPKKCIL